MHRQPILLPCMNGQGSTAPKPFMLQAYYARAFSWLTRRVAAASSISVCSTLLGARNASILQGFSHAFQLFSICLCLRGRIRKVQTACYRLRLKILRKVPTIVKHISMIWQVQMTATTVCWSETVCDATSFVTPGLSAVGVQCQLPNAIYLIPNICREPALHLNQSSVIVKLVEWNIMHNKRFQCPA